MVRLLEYSYCSHVENQRTVLVRPITAVVVVVFHGRTQTERGAPHVAVQQWTQTVVVIAVWRV